MAQTNNFEFIQYDTAYVGSEDFVIQHGDVFNLSDTDLFLTVTRVEHQKPATWSSSFCFNGHCLPPFFNVDTSVVFAGDTAVFSLDTFPNEEVGVGSWTIFVADSATMEVDSVHITLEYVTVSIADDPIAPRTFNLSNIYPNPTNAWINFDFSVERSGAYSIVLYTLDGRAVATRDYALRAGNNHLQWGLGALPSGSYIISATSQGQKVSRQLVVIK
jgi:hypothetical protein